MGFELSKGAVLLFVDADSRLQTNCLAALSSTIAQSPQHDYFQLRLVGDCSSLVGRAEELRLVNFQDHVLQPDGRIRYLNTAGFAIRRTRVDIETGVFDPVALQRGGHSLIGEVDASWRTTAVCSRCNCRTLCPFVFVGISPKRSSISQTGNGSLRHHRFQGSKNSSDSSGASEIAIFDVEDCPPGFDRTIRMVCASLKARI